MEHTIMKSPDHESTYALLMRSEDKKQSMSETAVYMVLILSALFSFWFAAHQPVRLPLSTVSHTVSIAQSEPLPHPTI